MSLINRFMIVVRHALKGNLVGIGEPFLHVLEQLALIALQTQHVVSMVVPNLLGDPLLTTHRINGDNTAIDTQQVEQFGNSRDFVGFGIDFALAQTYPIGGRPGIHQVNSPFANRFVLAAHHRFAINRDDLPLGDREHLVNPTPKTSLKGVGINHSKHISKRIM